MRRRGSAAIEMGMTLPLLIFLLAAVVDWGSYMSLRTSVARAAMDGARRGAAVYEDDSVANPGDLIVPAAENRAQMILDEMGIGCPAATCSIDGEYCDVGEAANNCNSPPLNAVLVTVSYQYTPFFGFAAAPTMITERSIFASESNN
ncbi:MAG: pilus assembly protein [Alphaproteobacteria bacterium]|nr:pilus assembly protein [Alphaproteobacteria bacterium]